MSQWLGSWDSLATGVYRPGVEMFEEQAQAFLENAIIESEDRVESRFPVLRHLVFLTFIVTIGCLILFTKQLSFIFF